MTSRVAVVGSSGFVGQALVERLSTLGIDTVALSRSNTPDLRDVDADWSPFFAGCDAVVNCAGKAHDLSDLSIDDARTYVLVNGIAPGTLARAAMAARVDRFVHLSTVKVLGDRTNGIPFRESDPPNPQGVYALSKALGERQVITSTKGSSTSAVIVRIPLVIGRPFKGNLALMERAIRAGMPLPLGHPSVAKRSYVRMEDLVDLLLRVCRAPGDLPEILHTRSHPDLTAGELAELVGAEVGRRPRFVSIPAPLLSLGAGVLGQRQAAKKLTGEMLMSDEDTRLALGFQPV